MTTTTGLSRRGLLSATLLAGGAALALRPGPARAQAKPGWPRALTLGTASAGGTFAVYGQVWATLVGEKIGLTISTQQTQGPNQNIILLEGGDLELGMTTMGVALQAWEGKGDWTQGRQYRSIRALFPMYDTAFHFVALRRSGIASVAQLAGKRVGVGPRAGTPGTYFPLMFQELGLQGVTIANGQAADMASQLADGLIDCFAFAAGLPFPAYAELEATNEVTFFSFAPEEIERLKAALPELSDALIPAGTYKGVAADQPTLGVFNFAICRRDLPEDLAYAIVEAVHAGHDELVRGHAAARETLPENVSRNGFLPFHPGAARYYREKGFAIPDELVGT
jgi:uncharacterized protein